MLVPWNFVISGFHCTSLSCLFSALYFVVSVILYTTKMYLCMVWKSFLSYKYKQYGTYLCSLKELALYLCVVSFSRLLGRLMMVIASNGHFCINRIMSIMHVNPHSIISFSVLKYCNSCAWQPEYSILNKHLKARFACWIRLCNQLQFSALNNNIIIHHNLLNKIRFN